MPNGASENTRHSHSQGLARTVAPVRSFRFNAKNVFLTYPKCSETKEDLREYFKTFEPPVAFGIIAHELHEDGTDHLHAVIGFKTKYSTRDQRSFDWRGFHPNIQSPRVLSDVISYVRKDGAVVEFGSIPNSNARGSANWESISNAASKSDFMSLVKTESPKVIYLLLV